MTSQFRTALLLALEIILLAGMIGSFVYFVRESRDVMLTHPEAMLAGPDHKG